MSKIKKLTKKEAAINYIMETAQDAVKRTIGSFTIVTYSNTSKRLGKSLPCIAVWTGRSFRPSVSRMFYTEAERNETYETYVKSANDQIKREQESLRRGAEAAAKIQEGIILYSCWGYEQTNINWYIVTKRSGSMVTLQEIGANRTYSMDDRGNCTPDAKTTKGEPIRKRINKWGEISLTSYSSAYLWDGQAKSWSSYA